MVLGDVVEERPVPGPAARATGSRDAHQASLADEPTAIGAALPGQAGVGRPDPGAAVADPGGIDDDVLAAYLAARGRG
jgi:hypothetical protein